MEFWVYVVAPPKKEGKTEPILTVSQVSKAGQDPSEAVPDVPSSAQDLEDTSRMGGAKA